MITPDIVREFMTKDAADITIHPEAVVLVCPQTQLDDLSGIQIQAEQVRVFVRRKFSKQPDGKSVRQHDMFDCWIRRESLQEF
jgi:hypothetical protein